jgi:hypothetical protein
VSRAKAMPVTAEDCRRQDAAPPNYPSHIDFGDMSVSGSMSVARPGDVALPRRGALPVAGAQHERRGAGPGASRTARAAGLA